MQTLIINAHPDPQNKTAYCTNRLVDCLTEKLPDATVLNLYNEDIPELTAETLPVFNGAYSGEGKDAELSKGAQHFLARNAELLEQFKAASTVSVFTPAVSSHLALHARTSRPEVSSSSTSRSSRTVLPQACLSKYFFKAAMKFS